MPLRRQSEWASLVRPSVDLTLYALFLEEQQLLREAKRRKVAIIWSIEREMKYRQAHPSLSRPGRPMPDSIMRSIQKYHNIQRRRQDKRQPLLADVKKLFMFVGALFWAHAALSEILH
ncbi:hypothetical protein C8R43DRAFT_1130472 [Mycena crocata]|nr:hypothetical protein C8R43DRAFT_1130472 [Mycena crocata]